MEMRFYLTKTVTILSCLINIHCANAENVVYVSQEKTAVKIAEAIISEYMGNSYLNNNRVISVIMNDNVWEIEFGSKNRDVDGYINVGGGVGVRINRETGGIVNIFIAP